MTKKNTGGTRSAIRRNQRGKSGRVNGIEPNPKVAYNKINQVNAYIIFLLFLLGGGFFLESDFFSSCAARSKGKKDDRLPARVKQGPRASAACRSWRHHQVWVQVPARACKERLRDRRHQQVQREKNTFWSTASRASRSAAFPTSSGRISTSTTSTTWKARSMSWSAWKWSVQREHRRSGQRPAQARAPEEEREARCGKSSRHGVAGSDQGRTRNTRGEIRTPRPREDGYCYVMIEKKNILVHHAVAEAFGIPDYEHGKELNHKNGNPSDNRRSNLEWVWRPENIHIIRDKPRAQVGKDKQSVPVECSRGRRVDAVPQRGRRGAR